MKWNDIYWIFQTFLTNQKLQNYVMLCGPTTRTWSIFAPPSASIPGELDGPCCSHGSTSDPRMSSRMRSHAAIAPRLLPRNLRPSLSSAGWSPSTSACPSPSLVSHLPVTGLSPSDGNTAILTVVDLFSKAAHFIPLPKLPSAKETGAVRLLDPWTTSRHGL